MIRKLLLPALLTGLLGGCVTEYGYRDGYYYGQPSVEYRYHDYGYPYGYYPGYYPYYYPYSGNYYRYYNYNYYPNYRYGYPYYPHYHHHHKPRPPVTGTPGSQPPPGTRDNDDNLPPWRDYTRRRRTQEVPDGLREAPGAREVPRGMREVPGGLRAQTPRPSPTVIRQPPRRETRDDDSHTQQQTPRREERRRRTGAEEP